MMGGQQPMATRLADANVAAAREQRRTLNIVYLGGGLIVLM
jgi:hypothetical protein